MVAAVLAAATAPAEAPLPGEAAALAAFRHSHRSPRRLRLLRPADNLKLFAATLCGGVVIASGVAAAATGTMPLVNHHSSHAHPANGHSTTNGTAGDTSSEDTSGGTSADEPGAQGKHQGPAVSDLAHTPGLTGVDKGQAVCATASDSQCQAGTHGSAAGTHSKSDAGTHGKSTGATPHQSTKQPAPTPRATPTPGHAATHTAPARDTASA
jgi:hypothetical protein